LIRALFFAFAALAAAGCSQLGVITDREEAERLWVDQQQAMQAVNDWDIHGRAFIKVDKRAYNVSLRWQRGIERFLMMLEAPFGRGVIRIEANGDGPYRLQLPDGQVFTRDTPEVLFKDVIGWSLPVTGLTYWIRGLPRPQSSYRHRIDQAGRMRSINQDGWTIDYRGYFAQQEQAQLPRKIILTRGRLTLKLVIERWQQAETETSPSDLFPEFD